MRAEIVKYIEDVAASVESICWDLYRRPPEVLTVAGRDMEKPIERLPQEKISRFYSTIPVPEMLVNTKSLAHLSDEELLEEVHKRAMAGGSIDVLDAAANAAHLRALKVGLEINGLRSSDPKDATKVAVAWIAERKRKAKAMREALCLEDSGCKHCDLMYTTMAKFGL